MPLTLGVAFFLIWSGFLGSWLETRPPGIRYSSWLIMAIASWLAADSCCLLVVSRLYWHGIAPPERGRTAVIVALFANRSNDEIQNTDIDEVFKQLQIFEHLSPNRHVGVYAIVKKMKQQAAAL